MPKVMLYVLQHLNGKWEELGRLKKDNEVEAKKFLDYMQETLNSYQGDPRVISLRLNDDELMFFNLNNGPIRIGIRYSMPPTRPLL